MSMFVPSSTARYLPSAAVFPPAFELGKWHPGQRTPGSGSLFLGVGQNIGSPYPTRSWPIPDRLPHPTQSVYTRCDIARSGCTQLLTPRPWSTHAQHGRCHHGRHLRRHAASNAINLSPGVPRHLRHRRPSCRRLHRRRATSASASVTSSATPLLGPSPAHAVGGCQETRPWAVLPCCSYRAPEPTTGLPPGPHSPAGPHSADRYRSLASRLPRLGQGRTPPHRCDHSTASRDPATCLPFLHCPVGTGSPHSVQTVVHFLSLRRQDIPPRNIQSNILAYCG